jgi:molecular chaperone DnaJ
VRSVRSAGIGDLFCRVQVETPVKLTDEQKEQLRIFEESLQIQGSRHSPRARSWFDGVKDFFERMGA